MKCVIAVGLLFISLAAYGQAFDQSLGSCAAFMNATNHYKAASQLITEYDPAGKSVPTVHSVENPEKMQEFVNWYLKNGRDQLFLTGQSCRFETLQKSGKEVAYRTAWFIEEENGIEAQAVIKYLLKFGCGKER